LASFTVKTSENQLCTKPNR